jgi:hypothetical protein
MFDNFEGKKQFIAISSKNRNIKDILTINTLIRVI